MLVCFVFLCELGTYAIGIKLRTFSCGQDQYPYCYSVSTATLAFSTQESCTQKQPSDCLLVTGVLQGKPNTTFYVDRKMEVFIQE